MLTMFQGHVDDHCALPAPPPMLLFLSGRQLGDAATASLKMCYLCIHSQQPQGSLGPPSVRELAMSQRWWWGEWELSQQSAIVASLKCLECPTSGQRTCG